MAVGSFPPLLDAIVDEINAQSFSYALVSERTYVPILESKQLGALRVTVVAAGRESELLTRRGDANHDYAVHVSVVQKIGQGPMSTAQINEVCDPLLALAEEITDHFRGIEVGGGRCMKADNIAIYSPDMIDENKVFASVIRLVIRKSS